MSPQLRKRLTTIGLTAALVAALLCVVGAIVWVERLPRGVADAASPADLATLESIERSFNWIAESVKPAVVFIEAEQAPPAERPEDALGPGPFTLPPGVAPDQFPPWFRDWFRDFYGPEGRGGPEAGPDAGPAWAGRWPGWRCMPRRPTGPRFR